MKKILFGIILSILIISLLSLSLISAEIIVNEDSSYITLFDPVNKQYYESPGIVDFSFKVAKSYEMEVCELILNGESVDLINKPISLSTHKLSSFVNNGKNNWKLKCTKRSTYGSGIEISEIRDLFIGHESLRPDISINLVSPEDNFSTTETNITFLFEFSETPSDVESCNLNINEDVFELDVSELSQGYLQELVVGEYVWNVDCIIDGYDFSSELFNLIIEAPMTIDTTDTTEPEENIDLDSGSSGGTGIACATTWKCFEWSGCEETVNEEGDTIGIQTRTCVEEDPKCFAVLSKPEESRECTLDNNQNQEINAVETQEDFTELEQNAFQKNISQITGAVVKVSDEITNNKPVGLGIGFVLIFGALGIFFYQYRRFKKK